VPLGVIGLIVRELSDELGDARAGTGAGYGNAVVLSPPNSPPIRAASVLAEACARRRGARRVFRCCRATDVTGDALYRHPAST